MNPLPANLPTKLLSASTVGLLTLGLGASAAVASGFDADDSTTDDNAVTTVVETEHLVIGSTTVPDEYSDLRVGIPVTWEVEVEVKNNEAATLDAVLGYSADFSSELEVETTDAEWVQEENDTSTSQQVWQTTDYMVNTEDNDDSMTVVVTMTPETDLEPEQDASMSLTLIAREFIEETEDDGAEDGSEPGDEGSPTASPTSSPSMTISPETEPETEPTSEPTTAPDATEADDETGAGSDDSQDGGVPFVPGPDDDAGTVGGQIETVTVTPGADGGVVVSDSVDSTDIESGVIPDLSNQQLPVGAVLLGLLGIGLASGAMLLWGKRKNASS